jgi:hypothetical protein
MVFPTFDSGFRARNQIFHNLPIIPKSEINGVYNNKLDRNQSRPSFFSGKLASQE